MEVIAEYVPSPIPAYRGNPLIEALPPIEEDAKILDRLKIFPPYHRDDRKKPSHERLHLVETAFTFFSPMLLHQQLEQRFSAMIRQGYLVRNPLPPTANSERKHRLDSMYSALTQSSLTMHPNVGRGFTIIGMPGVGKTAGVTRILELYPQVINHRLYNDHDLTERQVVWLRLECPGDASTKGLCREFFRKMDDLLHTGYERVYASRSATKDSMLLDMARVAANQHLGVLVIDEMQNLSVARSGGAWEVVNFLVQLRNLVGVPVVLIGTPDAEPFLTGRFHQARRGCGQGCVRWAPFQNDPLWEMFIGDLWTYQYTRVENPLTDELLAAMYWESQGVTDIAVKLYAFAQRRVISSSLRDDEEALTPELLRSVAEEELAFCQPTLEALRLGRRDKLSSDVVMRPTRKGLLQVASKSYPAEDGVAPCETDTQNVKADLLEGNSALLRVVRVVRETGVSKEEATEFALTALKELGQDASELDILNWVCNRAVKSRKKKTSGGSGSTRSQHGAPTNGSYAPRYDGDELLTIGDGAGDPKDSYDALKRAGLIRPSVAE